jgi:hypothetical protein
MISTKRDQAAAQFLDKHTYVYYLNYAKKCTTQQEYVQKFRDDWTLDYVLWTKYNKYQDCRTHCISQFLNGVNALHPLPVQKISGKD